MNQATAGTSASATRLLLVSHTAGCQASKARSRRCTSMFTVMLLAIAETRNCRIQKPGSTQGFQGR